MSLYVEDKLGVQETPNAQEILIKDNTKNDSFKIGYYTICAIEVAPDSQRCQNQDHLQTKLGCS